MKSTDRSKAPKAHPITRINFIYPEVETLKNGVNLYCIRQTNDRTVRIDFTFNAGSLNDAKVLAEIAGELLLSGDATQTSDVIEESIDQLGGYTEVKVNTEKATLTVFGLVEHILSITKIVVDAIQNVNFDSKELKQTIQERRKELKIRLQKVKTLAQRTFVSHILKETPYGELIHLDDFDKVKKEDLIDFHQRNYLNGLQQINIVGALEDKEIKDIKNLALRFNKKDTVIPNYSYTHTPTILHLEKDKALQTAIRVGRMLFNKKHTDYKKFIVLITLLGGYFGSRLMTPIREEKGYTYGIGSGVVQLSETGYFYIASEVAKEFKDATLNAIKAEIEKLQTTLVDNEELELVKNYLIGQILEQSDGAQAMMDRFNSVNYFGLTLNYYDDLIRTINQINPEEIKALAQRYLKWEDMTIVTVG